MTQVVPQKNPLNRERCILSLPEVPCLNSHTFLQELGKYFRPVDLLKMPQTELDKLYITSTIREISDEDRQGNAIFEADTPVKSYFQISILKQ
jgi:hypothetical protein